MTEQKKFSLEEAVEFLNTYAQPKYSRTPEQQAQDDIVWRAREAERKRAEAALKARHTALLSSVDPVVCAVVGLHKPDEDHPDQCSGCEWDCVEYAGKEPWPCPTWTLVASLVP